jgi:hypothetical protein
MRLRKSRTTFSLTTESRSFTLHSYGFRKDATPTLEILGVASRSDDTEALSVFHGNQKTSSCTLRQAALFGRWRGASHRTVR